MLHDLEAWPAGTTGEARRVRVQEATSMAERDIQKELEEKRRELREKGKPDQIGRPYDTSRELVEEGERKRTGTNLDIGEERSEEQEQEMKRWRR